MERKADIKRKTSETDISLKINLDGNCPSDITSGVPFFDHMMNAFAKHGQFYLELKCEGDTHIDDHHSVEDIGIVLGLAFKKALGDKKGISRFGFASVPMDDSLAQVSVDFSGRAYYKYTGCELSGYISDYAEELTNEFFYAFAANAGLNLHANLIYGQNRHHIHEALFKALAVAVREAKKIVSDEIPSTKGVI